MLRCIVNSSIETSLVPCVMKHAVLTPLLKKTGHDPENMMNYCPISNLSFVSKLLEKHVATHIAYRPAHSSETALVRIQDDILQSLDNRKSIILVLLVEQITCIFGVNRAHCDTSTKVGMGHLYGH